MAAFHNGASNWRATLKFACWLAEAGLPKLAGGSWPASPQRKPNMKDASAGGSQAGSRQQVLPATLCCGMQHSTWLSKEQQWET